MKRLILIFLLIPSLCFGADAAKIMGVASDPSGTNNVNKVDAITWGTTAGNATKVMGVAAAASPCQGANPSDCTKRETFNGSTACGDGSHSTCDNTWVSIVSWCDFNGGTLDGSTAMTCGGATNIVRLPAFTAAGTYYAAVKFSASARVSTIIAFTDSSDNDLCMATWGGGDTGKIGAKQAGGTTAYSTGTYSSSTLYYIKIKGVKVATSGDAKCTVWISTNGTSWTQIAESTDGTWTADISRLYLLGLTTVTNTFDDVRVYTGDISW